MGNNTSLITKMLVYHERCTRGVNYGKVQNMDQGSMDPLHGPGPWTGSIKIWTGSMNPFHGPGPWTPYHGPGPWTPYFCNKY